MSQWYEPWKPRVTVDWGLCWVEKLPVLTLSNKPFKLIASVETFEREIVFGFTVDGVDCFSKVCERWKVKFKVFWSRNFQVFFCCCSVAAQFPRIDFQFFCSVAWLCTQQTSDSQKKSIYVRFTSLCMSPWRNSLMTWLNVSSDKKWDEKSLMSDCEFIF